MVAVFRNYPLTEVHALMYHSPSHLYSRYRTLYASVLSGPAIGPLAVSRYQAAPSDPGSPNMQEKGRIISRIYQAIHQQPTSARYIEVPPEWALLFPERRIDKTAIMHSFAGGGSPEEIETTLTAAVKCGHLPAEVSEVQSFMDEFIGLDCCGFVGNYFQANHVRYGGNDDDPVPSPRTPPDAYTAWGETVKTRNEIRQDDILLFPIAARSRRHIVLIDYRLEDDCWVCESHGGVGPDRRIYRLIGGPDPLAPGVMMGTEHLPASDMLTFRFLHPQAGRINLMVRHVVAAQAAAAA